MRRPTNVAASVRARLTNLAKKTGRPFQSVLLRYLQERFLFRLAASKHADRFVLKGGLLLYGAYGLGDRATVDIDLLGRGVLGDGLADVIRDVASVSVNPFDGVVFFPESVEVEPITAATEYGGVRAHVSCQLEQARVTLQIDVGFGDAVVPKAVEVDFPVLLDGPPFRLIAYSLESAIAEKFEAMVRFSLSNSRMKDFYDVYVLSREKDFDGRVLQEATHETFDRRGTPRDRDIPLFAADFSTNPTMNAQWTAFISRIRTPAGVDLGFADVIARIGQFLGPIHKAICMEMEYQREWDSGAGMWVPYRDSEA